MAEPFFESGKWRFRYKDPVTGKRTMETTEANNLTEARSIQRAFLVKLNKIQVGIEVANPNPRKLTVEALVKWWLEEFCSQLASFDTDALSVKRHFTLEGLERARDADGAETRRRAFARFLSLRLEAVTPGEVEKWLHAKSQEQSMHGAPLSASTLNGLRSYLSRAFSKAIAHDRFVGANPVEKVAIRKVDVPLPIFLTKDEVRTVIDTARVYQPQWACLYACAFYTGLRKGELFALRWTDIELTESVILVQRSHARSTTKGRRGRLLYIMPELRPFLDAQKALRTTLVFPNPEGKQWHKKTRLDVRFAEVLKRAGIAKELRFHDTRDTFASLFLMGGGNIVALQEILGHRSIETTRTRYAHLDRSYVRDQMMAFSMSGGPAPAPPGSPRRDKEARQAAAGKGTQLCTPIAKRRVSNG